MNIKSYVYAIVNGQNGFLSKIMAYFFYKEDICCRCKSDCAVLQAPAANRSHLSHLHIKRREVSDISSILPIPATLTQTAGKKTKNEGRAFCKVCPKV